MIRIALTTALVIFTSIGGRAADSERLRLGVVVVVDQMRPDYLERDSTFSGGFKRLAGEGSVFTQARHLHVPTETAPGHAAISTGRAPITHGIVANDWYDRAAGAKVYCVADDPYGTGPGRLSGPTLADAMKAQDPRTRVFAVGGKDRSAVLLGGRRPDLVLWLDRSQGVFTTSSYYRRPAWLDDFNAKLLKSELLTKGGKKEKVPDEVFFSPALDEATALLVSELTRRENVGRGPSTDLLMVSFSATDLVGHRYGIEAPEMTAQLRAIDAILGRLMREWETASSHSIALALSSDHGAIPSPKDTSGKSLGVKQIMPRDLSAAMEAALQKRWPAADQKWIVFDGFPHLYLNGELAAKRGLDWLKLRREAARAIGGVGSIGRVLVTSDIPGLDDSDPLNAVLRRSVREDRAGDLFVLLRENVLLYEYPAGTTHGTSWSYDARVPLVFWGRGIRAAHSEAAAAPLDIAPTLGRLMGARYAAGDGGALRTEIVPVEPAAR